MVIKWSNFAQENLKDFAGHSKLSSPTSYVKELVKSVYILEDFPQAGKLRFYYQETEVRQLVHKMHRIIYRISNNEIIIGAVLHNSQDLDTSLKFMNRFFK